MALFTKYQLEKTQGTGGENRLLEETNKGPLAPEVVEAIFEVNPEGVLDRDQDGYAEVSLEDLTLAATRLGMETTAFPLATYFADNPVLGKSNVPFNFAATRRHFAAAYGFKQNPLQAVAKPLAKHLAQTAVHNVAVPDQRQTLDNENGFSVRGDGRLRFGCVNFANLAHSDLRDIFGLTFRQVVLFAPGVAKSSFPQTNIMSINNNMHPLDSPFQPQAKASPVVKEFRYSTESQGSTTQRSNHAILLVSDGDRHLIVDNETVIYFESSDPDDFIRNRYIGVGKFQSYKNYPLG